MGALLQTEEGIRSVLSEVRLPKIDLTQELRKALLGLKLHVKAEIQFTEAGPVVSHAKASLKDNTKDNKSEKKHDF